MPNLQSNVPPDNDAQTLNVEQAEQLYAKLKERAGRFRVLIMGGANAGKTTILKKICNTTEEPEIHNSNGEKIDTSNLEPTILRGEHDIENEMVFRSNPTFIFHDSRGFEAGGVDEFRKVKDFVAERAKKRYMSKQVHVIWYCIAMDDDRPVTYAEKQFFSESGTGKVPVIAVFTKCEALKVKAIANLEDEGYDFDEAVEKAPKYVEENLKNVHKILENMAYPPKGHLYLQELDKPERNCQCLVNCTAEALDNNALRGIFISTQQNNLELTMRYSLREGLDLALSCKGNSISDDTMFQMLKTVFVLFPFHFLDHRLRRRRLYLDRRLDDLDDRLDDYDAKGIITTKVVDSLQKLVASFKASQVSTQLVLLSCALPLIVEHLSIAWATKTVSADDIPPAIAFYQGSSCATKMIKAIPDVLSQYPDSVPHLHSHHHALLEELLPIILENRLD